MSSLFASLCMVCIRSHCSSFGSAHLHHYHHHHSLEAGRFDSIPKSLQLLHFLDMKPIESLCAYYTHRKIIKIKHLWHNYNFRSVVVYAFYGDCVTINLSDCTCVLATGGCEWDGVNFDEQEPPTVQCCGRYRWYSRPRQHASNIWKNCACSIQSNNACVIIYVCIVLWRDHSI